MSRFKNFSRNLSASYLQLFVNVAYSLVSVPLILHWLSQAEFGLWAVLTQIMSYSLLVDLGINQAVSRFLVDHKDQRGDGVYGSLLKTSALVSVLQGLAILVIAMVASPLLATLMKVPPQYEATFITLLRIQGMITAFTFVTNPLGIMLFAHQRIDIVNRQNMGSLMVSLGLVVLFLFRGLGIYSFVYANAITALLCPFYLFWHCRRLELIPHAGEWGSISWEKFKEVFLYGKDVFLMNVGAQLILASQTIIITRKLGLESAAAWAIGTKVFLVVRLLMFQPFGAAAPGFFEMMSRNESDRLRSRFRNLVVLITSLGVFLGTAFALCNSLFINVWTNGKIPWSPANDVILGIWIFFTAVQVPHCNFVTVTKRIGGMRYVYFFEGCTFVILSLFLGYRGGLSGIIAVSVCCVVLFSCQFGLRKSEKYFHATFAELAIGWIRPSLKLAAVLIPLALVIWYSGSGLPVLWRLVANAVAITFIGGFLFLRIGLPSEMIREAGARLPRSAARFLESFAQ
jgi:O-antigen/teichoic acid export membrane protein